MMTETLMVVEPHEDDRTAPSAFVSQAKPSRVWTPHRRLSRWCCPRHSAR